MMHGLTNLKLINVHFLTAYIYSHTYQVHVIAALLYYCEDLLLNSVMPVSLPSRKLMLTVHINSHRNQSPSEKVEMGETI